MKKTGLLKSYSGATRLLAPALPFWLKARARKGKEDPARLGERNGITNTPRPGGPLIWMHAASVGESQMLLPLINRIKRDRFGVSMVITTGTVTSAALLEKRLPIGAVHQYAPADHPKAVHNFLEHWQPDMAIFAESELWPNMIFGAKKRGIPLALVNARMSKNSIERWERKAKKSAKAILGAFDIILAANTETANGLSWLSGLDIESSGNLKDAASPLPVDEDNFKTFNAAIERRKVWCAASTHEGEESLLLDALLTVKAKYPKSLLLLAPRHPERALKVETLLKTAGYKTQLRSDGEPPAKDTDIYIVDSIGDLGLIYRLCDVAFIGGSLIDGLSGHNPLEASRLNCPVITGPNISSFADTYMALMALGGVQRILDPDALGDTIVKLMADRKTQASLKKAAMDYAKSRDAVLDFVWEQLLPLLPEGQ